MLSRNLDVPIEKIGGETGSRLPHAARIWRCSRAATSRRCSGSPMLTREQPEARDIEAVMLADDLVAPNFSLPLIFHVRTGTCWYPQRKGLTQRVGDPDRI
jgi:hypothetical protein